MSAIRSVYFPNALRLLSIFRACFLSLTTLASTRTPTPPPTPVSVSVADVTLREGSSGEVFAQFQVTANPAPTTPIEIPYRTIPGSALSEIDFTPSEGIAVLTADITSTTIRVPVIPDQLAEGVETFELILLATPGAAFAKPRAVATLLDDDIPVVSARNVTVLEGSDSERVVKVPLSLSLPSAIPVSVQFRLVPDSAQSPSDFALTNGIVHFPAGSQHEDFTFLLRGDLIAEFDESLQVVLSQPVNASIASPSSQVLILDDDPTPNLSVTGTSIRESTGTNRLLDFHLQLSGPSTQPVRVSYSTRAGTATASTDYLSRLGTLVISPGDTEAVLSVTILGDALAEPDESFSLVLRNPINATLEQAEAIGYILDDDRPLSIAVSGSSAIEGSAAKPGTLTFEVLLSAPPTNTVVVNYATRPLTATPGTDFLTTTGILTFVAIGTGTGNTRHLVRIPIVGDDLAEANERLELQLSHPVHAVLDQPTAFGEILNDDGATLSIDDARVDEGSSGTTTVVFTVRRQGPTQDTTTVSYRTVPLTASPDLDFVPRSGRITFLPGESIATVPVVIQADLRDEPDETFRLELLDPVDATLLRPSAVATIVDDDLPGFRVDPVMMPEGNTAPTYAQFLVRLDSPPAQEASVQFRVESRSATAGEDFLPLTGILTFPPGIRERPVAVPILGDVANENDETFALVLFNPQFAATPSPETLATLLNDDPAPFLTIQDVEARECTGDDASATADFPVQLSAASGRVVEVPFQTRPITALSGEDFQSISGSLVFPPGTTRSFIRVPLVCDSNDERDEFFEVQLGAPTNAVLSRARARGRLLDDDPPSLTVSDRVVTEGGAEPQFGELTFTLTSPTTEIVTLEAETLPGTAVAGSDFLALTQTVVILPGTLSSSLRIPIVGDTVGEDVENFRVVLRNPRGVRLTREFAEITVLDDDLPLIQFEDSRVAEGDVGTRDIEIPLRLSRASPTPLTLQFRTTPMTATAGEDYLPVEGQVVFQPGQTVATLRIQILGDTRVESAETLGVAFSTADAVAIERSPMLVTIIDDEAPPSILVADASFFVSRTETTSISIPLTLSQPSSEVIEVPFATESETAVSPNDFASALGSLTFQPGETRQMLTIQVSPNADSEPDETFAIRFGPALRAVLSTPKIQVTLITEPRPQRPPTISLVVPENADGTTVGQTLLLTANVSDPDDDLISVSFHAEETLLGRTTTAPHALTWIPKEPGTYSLTAQASDASGLVSTSAPVSLRILEQPRIRALDARIPESAGFARIPLQLSRAAREPVAVRIATRDQTATAPADYLPLTARVVFSPGETNQFTEIPVLQDSARESEESFILELGSPENAQLDVERITVSITDDDDQPATNAPPTVRLLSPIHLAVFPLSSVLTLEAEAADPDGAVSQVEFFVDNRSIGTTAQSPYRWVTQPLGYGDHILQARALDSQGSFALSSPVRITVANSCGRTAIIANGIDPEIEVLRRYLFDWGIDARVFDRTTAKLDTLQGFDLIVWHDGGQRGLGPAEVNLLDALAASGKPLFLIGDRLVESTADLDGNTQALWTRLIRLRPGPPAPPAAEVLILTTEPPPSVRAIIRGGPAGDVGDFNYPFESAAGTRSEPDREVVLAQAGDRDVFMALPEDESNRTPRRIAQAFRVASGTDPESLTQRKRLFLNAVAWLLRCSHCANVNVAPLASVDPAPAPDSGALWFTLRLHASGACEALGVRIASQLPANLQLIRAETSRGTWDSTADGSMITFDVGRVQTGADEMVRILARPRNPGTATTRFTVNSFNESAGALDDNEIEVSSNVEGFPSLEIRRRSPGLLELIVTGPLETPLAVESAPSPLGPWRESSILRLTPDQSRALVPLETATSPRFFRIRTL